MKEGDFNGYMVFNFTNLRDVRLVNMPDGSELHKPQDGIFIPFLQNGIHVSETGNVLLNLKPIRFIPRKFSPAANLFVPQMCWQRYRQMEQEGYAPLDNGDYAEKACLLHFKHLAYMHKKKS